MDFARLSDEQMVILLARRDENALSTLYDRHANRVLGVAMAVLHDLSAAEEVTQEVFLKLWRQPESFDSSRGRFVSWFLSVARHQAIDRLRSSHGLSTGAVPDVELAEDMADDHLGPDEEAWISVRRQAVRRALGELPQAQREVLALAYFAGLSQQEIAQRLDQPLGTVKTRTRLAMQKLRAGLGELGLELQSP